MARIELDELHLWVRFARAEKVFGLVGDLVVPRAADRSGTVTADGRRHERGWRVGPWGPGGLMLAGRRPVRGAGGQRGRRRAGLP